MLYELPRSRLNTESLRDVARILRGVDDRQNMRGVIRDAEQHEIREGVLQRPADTRLDFRLRQRVGTDLFEATP